MPNAAPIAIYALTQKGLILAEKLARSLRGEVHCLERLAGEGVTPFKSLPEHVAATFSRYDGHVFVAAAGIAIRCIAPHLRTKDTDPAVVCLDQEGRFAVSLLSGHLGGANSLAEQCAAVTGGQAVITTATDSAGLPSVDMLAKARNMAIGNLERVKVVNGAILDKQTVQVYDRRNRLGVADEPWVQRVDKPGDWRTGDPGVWVSCRDDCPDADALWLYPRDLMLGVGCRRGVGEDEIYAHIRDVFDAAGLSMDAIGGLGSIEDKADEPGLLAVARELGVEPVFYPKNELDTVDAPNPSGTVMRRMGVESVSEAAAILLSGGGELIVEKTKTKTVTLAVARRIIC